MSPDKPFGPQWTLLNQSESFWAPVFRVANNFFYYFTIWMGIIYLTIFIRQFSQKLLYLNPWIFNCFLLLNFNELYWIFSQFNYLVLLWKSFPVNIDTVCCSLTAKLLLLCLLYTNRVKLAQNVFVRPLTRIIQSFRIRFV